jgi:hypothetical protein
MTKIISYIHLLGCIGWSICGLVLLTTEDSVGGKVLALFALFTTTASGCLFVLGHNVQLGKLESIKTHNALLMTKIISCIHLMGCIGWSVWGLLLLKEWLEYPDTAGGFIFFALFTTTASGVYLFIVWMRDWVWVLYRHLEAFGVWKILLWTGVVVVVLMCLFPPWVRGEPPTGYAFIAMPPSKSARIDLGRLAVQIVPVVAIAVGIIATKALKKQ